MLYKIILKQKINVFLIKEEKFYIYKFFLSFFFIILWGAFFFYLQWILITCHGIESGNKNTKFFFGNLKTNEKYFIVVIFYSAISLFIFLNANFAIK